METIEAVQNALGSDYQSLFLSITQLGSDFAYITVLVLYYLVIDPKGGREAGLYFTLSLLVNTGLKDLIAEPRPYATNPKLASAAAQATAGGYSFPSGHAQVTATLWGILALQIHRTWFWVLATVLTLSVGFSRIYLGVHYLTDVLWGLAIGVSLVGLAAFVKLPSSKNQVNWLLIPLSGIAAGFLSEDWGRALGIGSAFLLTQTQFKVPKSPLTKVGIGVLGLAVSIGFYLLTSLLLPEAFKRSGLGSFVRYLALTLLVTEGLPYLLFRSRSRPTPQGAL